MFAGLRAAISEKIVVRTKTKRALEHAYVRALFGSIGEIMPGINEGIWVFECAQNKRYYTLSR